MNTSSLIKIPLTPAKFFHYFQKAPECLMSYKISHYSYNHIPYIEGCYVKNNYHQHMRTIC